METCFDNIPDDVLLQVCSSCNDSTLLNISRINTRLYDFCFPIIEQRKKAYQLAQKVKTITDHILTAHLLEAKVNKEQTIFFNLGGSHEYRQAIHNISDQISTEDYLAKYPWLFTEIKILDQGYSLRFPGIDSWIRISFVNERSLIETIVKRLISGKYEIICHDLVHGVSTILNQSENLDSLTEKVEQMQV